MARVGGKTRHIDQSDIARAGGEVDSTSWRPADKTDAVGDLFDGLDLFASFVRDTVKQLQEDPTVDDPRTSLAEALVVAVRTYGKAEHGYTVLSSAVKTARNNEDTWDALTSAYKKYIGIAHARAAAAQGVPRVCFVRYRGSRERMATFQLWVHSDRTSRDTTMPRFVRDYPICDPSTPPNAASIGSAATRYPTTCASGADGSKESDAASVDAVDASAGTEQHVKVTSVEPDTSGRPSRKESNTGPTTGQALQPRDLHSPGVLLLLSQSLVQGGSPASFGTIVVVAGLLVLAFMLGTADALLDTALRRVLDVARGLLNALSSWSVR